LKNSKFKIILPLLLLSVIFFGSFIIFLPQIQALIKPNFPQLKIPTYVIKVPPPPSPWPPPSFLDEDYDNRMAYDDSNIMNLGINAEISECKQYLLSSKEALFWHYDKELQTLKFINKNVELNCCGKLFVSISYYEDTGSYVINEIDYPGYGRCGCICMYDIKIDLPNIDIEKCINLKINRQFTDEHVYSYFRSFIWEKELNLQQGNGKVFIKKSISSDKDKRSLTNSVAPNKIIVPTSDKKLSITIGIERYGGLIDIIFPADTNLPISAERTFSTVEDYQREVDIYLLQGFRPLAQYNKTFAKFQIIKLPWLLRGAPKIVTSFHIDEKGILTVSAKEDSSGREAEIFILYSNILYFEEVNKMKREALRFAKEDEKKVQNIKTKNYAELMLYVVENHILKQIIIIPSAVRKRIDALVEEIKNLINI
jgi:hypothetical protein